MYEPGGTYSRWIFFWSIGHRARRAPAHGQPDERRADPSSPGQHRAPESDLERLRSCRCARGAGPGAQGRRAVRPGPGPGPAARHTGGGQRQHRHLRLRHHLRLCSFRRLQAEPRCAVCATSTRGRCGDCRQDLDPRIRLRPDRRPFAAGRGAQPVGCRLHHRRLQRRQRRGSGQRHGAAGAGHRHRRLDPDSGGVVRGGRVQALVCQRAAGRRVPAGVEPRPRRPDRQPHRGRAPAVRSGGGAGLCAEDIFSAATGRLDHQRQLRPGRRRTGSAGLPGRAAAVRRGPGGDSRTAATGGRHERHLVGAATRRGLRGACRTHAGCTAHVRAGGTRAPRSVP
ncbi:hypothetical protein D3C84_658890 [compost metagenome]